VRKLGQHCAKWLIGYGYHCFYAFLWLAGLFTVTALIAVFWLGPDKYIVAEPAAGTPAAAAATRAAAIASPPASAAAPAAATPSAATPALATPAATPSAPVTPSASASPPASPAAPASASPTPRSLATARPGACTAATECSNPARIGYAIELAFPVINLNSSSAAQCDVPASGAAAGVVVFGWLVRAAAAALLALYTLGLAGVTRSPPSGS
jgi:ribonuclease E